MANAFITDLSQAGKIASTALSLLQPQMVLARTINRDFEKEFEGGVGKTVNVKRPFAFAANSRNYDVTSAITVSDVSEPATQPVTIQKQIYSAVATTDEQTNFEIEDFAEQILKPQVEAVAFGIEQEAATIIQTAPAAGVTTTSVDSLADARKVLGLHGVPIGGLVCAVAPDVAATWLKSAALKDASQSGDTGALRDASLGRLFGIPVFESPMLTAGTGYVYHRDAFTMVLRAPKVPDGAVKGSAVSGGGYALRWIQDYDSNVLSDRSIVNVWVGTKAMTLTERQPNGTVSSYLPAIKLTATGS